MLSDSLHQPSFGYASGETSFPCERMNMSTQLDYNGDFCWQQQRTLVSKLHQQMVMLLGPSFKVHFQSLPHWIFKSDVENWWERRCSSFIQQEAELRHKRFKVVKRTVLYSEPARDQYKIFWIRFPEDVFQWLYRLQESLEYKY